MTARGPTIVAELSGNHNGSLERALDLVRAASAAGADAVKLQTYTADTITLDADGPSFRISDGHELWGARTLYDLYQEAHTPYEWHAPIFALARELGIVAFSAPFDESAVAFLEDLGTPMYKIASLEIVDLPLIQAAAATGKPLVLSTGAATLDEVRAAAGAATAAGCTDLTLLVCTSSYPASPDDADLHRIPALAAEFPGVKVGLSDHTAGIGVSVAAVALGATMIEKHLTLDRSDGGVDSAFSLEPAELAQLVRECDAAARSLGSPLFGPRSAEAESLRLRPSLWVIRDVRAGETVTDDTVRSLRPSGGLAPAELEFARGRKFASDVRRGTPLSWDHLE